MKRARSAVVVVALALFALVGALLQRRRKAASETPARPPRPVRNEGDFRAIFLLIVSLLHGTLFFILGERLVSVIIDFSLERLSLIVLFYSLFFRILQTHLLAAVKYDGAWRIKPYDFIFIFFTALVEYLVFMHDTIAPSREWFLRTMLVVFAAFGIVGYALTYASTRRSIESAEDLRRERIVQTTNIVVVVLLGSLCLIDLLWTPFPAFFVVVNFVIAAALWVNIYVSIRLSKVVL